jgi:D-alanyl-D-alanine carboxypeptidase
VLLGDLVAKVSGLCFAAYVHQRILPALGLSPGETLNFAIEYPAAHARGCFRRISLTGALMAWALSGTALVAGRAGPWTVLHDHCVNGDAYGGLVCNATGLLRYATALMTPGRLLRNASLSLLLDPAAGPGPSHSLGWFCGKLHGARWCAHAGGGAGYYGELRIYPDLGCASALLLNRPGLRDARLLDDVDAELIAAHAQPRQTRPLAKRR